MSGITSGRTEAPNNNIGGLKNIYLFDYVEYQKYLITTTSNVLNIYPATTVFKYELRADGNTFSSGFQDGEDGVSYNHSLSIVLKGVLDDRTEIIGLLNKRLGCIVETRLGHFQIIGMYNGCRVKSIKEQTGGGYEDFSGYNIDIEGKEEQEPFFITNLFSAGFDVFSTDNLLQEDAFYLLQENGDKIII